MVRQCLSWFGFSQPLWENQTSVFWTEFSSVFCWNSALCTWEWFGRADPGDGPGQHHMSLVGLPRTSQGTVPKMPWQCLCMSLVDTRAYRYIHYCHHPLVLFLSGGFLELNPKLFWNCISNMQSFTASIAGEWGVINTGMFAFYFWLLSFGSKSWVSLGLSLPVGLSGCCCIPAGEHGGVFCGCFKKRGDCAWKMWAINCFLRHLSELLSCVTGWRLCFPALRCLLLKCSWIGFFGGLDREES